MTEINRVPTHARLTRECECGVPSKSKIWHQTVHTVSVSMALGEAVTPNPPLVYRGYDEMKRRRVGTARTYPNAVAFVEDCFKAGWQRLAVTLHGDEVGGISQTGWWAESTT